MSEHSQNLLGRIVTAAERYADAHPMFEVGPLLLAAVSTAALREVAIARNQLPRGVQWVMMSCQSQDPAAWQAISLVEDNSIASRPISIALPDALATFLAGFTALVTHGPDLDVPAILKPLEWSMTEIAVPPLLPVSRIYFRSSFIRLPEPHSSVRVGSMVGASAALENSEEASVDHHLSTAERVVADRIFQGLGGYRPVASILAAIDDGFQNSLIAARSIPDWTAILDSFYVKNAALSTSTMISTPVSSVRVKVPDRTTNTKSPGEVSDLNTLIRDYLEHTYKASLGDLILQTSSTADVTGRYGNWHAFAQFGFGLAGFRSQSVLFSICETRESVEQSLARYVAILQANSKNVEIVILLPEMMQEYLEHYTQTWQQVKGVHFGRLR